jgi:archaellum component FlaC
MVSEAMGYEDVRVKIVNKLAGSIASLMDEAESEFREKEAAIGTFRQETDQKISGIYSEVQALKAAYEELSGNIRSNMDLLNKRFEEERVKNIEELERVVGEAFIEARKLGKSKK